MDFIVIALQNFFRLAFRLSVAGLCGEVLVLRGCRSGFCKKSPEAATC